MKTIKEYLNEDFFGNLGIGKKAAIENWLKEHKIYKYTINKDLSIDITDVVYIDISDNNTKNELPEYINFNKAHEFMIYSSTSLTSLRGCPKECYKFWVTGCPNLKSLEGGPEKCYQFNCSKSGITSLKGCPTKCQEFICQNCKNLKRLTHCPKKLHILSCYGCGGHFTDEDVKKHKIQTSYKNLFTDDTFENLNNLNIFS